MAKKLSPLALVTARFAQRGITKYGIAKGISRPVGAVYQWQYRGAGIPKQAQKPLLDFAREKNVKLTAAEIIEGGTL